MQGMMATKQFSPFGFQSDVRHEYFHPNQGQ